MFRTIVMALAILSLTACGKDGGTNSNNSPSGCSTPSASSNGSVNMGSSIMLTTPAVSGATYHWSGPLFSSTQQNPVIPNAVPGMAGTYYLHTSTSGCTSDSTPVNVAVTNLIAEGGSPAVNTATVTDLATNTTSNLNLNPFCMYVSPEYQVTASDSGGTYGLIFHFATMPTKTGIYNVISTTLPGAFSVYITIDGIKQSRSYNATGGYAYVTYNSNGGYMVSIYNMHFTSPIFTNSNLTVSATVACE